MGEWAIYALLAMLLITLWKRFPYRPWRFLHQAMPALYLMLAFHAVLLAPAVYWTQPAGWLLAVLITGGGYGSIVALSGRIGRSRQFQGEIVAVDRSLPAVVAVRCRLHQRWPGHRPGQFAFIRFDDREGQHPFTIASADHGDRQLSFEIKALGDYTRSLGKRLQAGQPVYVEGPYGRFDIARHDRQAQQIWIAGGIGVTPFLAWLESLQERPDDAPAAELHYCTRDRVADPHVARLVALCASLPTLRLQVHGSRQGEELTAGTLAAGKDTSRRAEVWFCGPQGLATTLQDGLQRIWRGSLRFHEEAFALR
jgi:predicted ferric reductase